MYPCASLGPYELARALASRDTACPVLAGIDSLPAPSQEVLLRAIEGDAGVRRLVATARDTLSQAVEAGRLRADLAQRLDSRGPAVAHRGAEAADHLVDEVGEVAAVGDASLDALGDELAVGWTSGLAVAVGGARAHRALRAHAAVGLVASAAVEDQFARALVHAREQRSEHHAACPRWRSPWRCRRCAGRRRRR